MAKATPLTEGTTKTTVKTPTAAKKPAPPPAPTKKVATKKVVEPKEETPPAKVTRTKKVTPVVSALFEELEKATPKPRAKKVVAQPEPAKPSPAKKVTTKTVASPTVVAPAKVVEPPVKTVKKSVPKVEPIAEETAANVGLVVAENPLAKKVMSKEEIAIDLSWAKLFNAYLKRDLKQAVDTVAMLTKQLSKK